MSDEGKRTPIDQSLIDRVAGRVSGVVVGAIRGASEAWFGPQQPLPAMAPAEVAGRAFDYPVAVNLQYRPRGEAGQGTVDFQTLRALADPGLGGLDLVRLAIETRKDQMAAQKWILKPRRDDDDRSPLTPGEKSLIRGIRDKLTKPDGINNFRAWQRMLVEDLLVIDAPTVYLAPGPGADKVPEVVDGATIKRLVRPDGRTPIFPDPAYMQALKGLPAVHYTTAELVYSPRNPRSDRLYGMSPTEQVISTINIALRRQLSQGEYYTAGSVPDAVFGVPATWSADQIRQFQTYWDSILAGNTEERRRARFIPGDVKPTMLKPDQLKDDYDEWLARIVCWCYSLSPGALVRDMNRATADTNANTARLEGLEPLKLWFGDLMDEILVKGFTDGAAVCWGWADEEITSPEVKARVFQIARGGKSWLTADEVRSEYGKQPLTLEQRLELEPPVAPIGGGPDPGIETPDLGVAAPGENVQLQSMNGAQVASLLEIVESVSTGKLPRESALVIIQTAFSVSAETADSLLGSASASEPAPLPAPVEKVADVLRAHGEATALAIKASRRTGKSVQPIDRARPEMRKVEREIAGACSRFFDTARDRAMSAARRGLGPEGVLAVVDGTDAETLREDLSVILAKGARSGVRIGFAQVARASRVDRVAKGGETPRELLDLANEQAIEWAEDRAAELVGMHRNDDGSYSRSKVPGIAITSSTREMLKGLTEKALEEGWSNDDFADEIEEAAAFSPERSLTIARTETAFADLNGNRIGWRESGLVVAREWTIGTEDPEMCDSCRAMDGKRVGVEESFDPDPPLHPNCRCDEIPILSDESDDDEALEAAARSAELRTVAEAAKATTAAVEKLAATVSSKPREVVFTRDGSGRIVGATTKNERG